MNGDIVRLSFFIIRGESEIQMAAFPDQGKDITKKIAKSFKKY